MKKKIIVKCMANGTMEIEGFGFVGSECNAAMRAFEAEMGTRTTRVNKTDTQNQARVNVQEV